MNTSENQWEKSAFVRLDHVVHKPRTITRRPEKRLTGIVRAEKVHYRPEPIAINPEKDNIQITPVIKDGQVRALRVVCSCGCESTFDIQYAAGGQNA
jgi:hypothetical protein